MNKTYQLVQCSLTFQSNERIHVKWETYMSVSWRARIVVVGAAVSKRAKGIKKMSLLKKHAHLAKIYGLTDILVPYSIFCYRCKQLKKYYTHIKLFFRGVDIS